MEPVERAHDLAVPAGEAETSAVVEFDPAVYRLSAVKKAAYRLGGRFYAQIEADGPTTRVTLVPKQPAEDLARAAGELRNEALDQELREAVAEETAGVRNLLLAQAFSATSLADPVGENADFRDDPLGIARPDPRPAGSDG